MTSDYRKNGSSRSQTLIIVENKNYEALTIFIHSLYNDEKSWNFSSPNKLIISLTRLNNRGEFAPGLGRVK